MVNPLTYGQWVSSLISCWPATRHLTATASNWRCRPSSPVITSLSQARFATVPYTFSHLRWTEEYWGNVSETAKSFVRSCLTVDPALRPSAAEMLEHRWLADEKPHFVPDPESPTGGPTDLLPHIQKRLDAKARCKLPIHLSFLIVMFMRFLACSPARGVGNCCNEAHVDACFAFKRQRRRARSKHPPIQGRIRERGRKRGAFASVLSILWAPLSTDWQEHEVLHHHNREDGGDGSQHKEDAGLESAMKTMSVQNTQENT
jgi:hypothetical protein